MWMDTYVLQVTTDCLIGHSAGSDKL